jgi:hypothetical protein
VAGRRIVEEDHRDDGAERITLQHPARLDRHLVDRVAEDDARRKDRFTSWITVARFLTSTIRMSLRSAKARTSSGGACPPGE